MVCVKGGPISDVEAREMPLIREQIVTDLGKIGISPVITIEKVESFVALKDLVRKLSPELCSSPASLKQANARVASVGESARSQKVEQ
jgi:hypothetical protein